MNERGPQPSNQKVEKKSSVEYPMVVEHKQADLLRLLDGYFKELQALKPTVLDFHGLPAVPKGRQEEVFLNWIETTVGVPPEEITGEGDPEKSKRFYFNLNMAYQLGKNFLVETLKYAPNQVTLGPDSLTSKQALFGLLEKTKLANGSEDESASNYCRIVKATIIGFETLREDAKLLHELSKELDAKLVATPGSARGESDLPPLVVYNQHQDFYATKDGGVKGSISSRGKKIEHAMLKFLTRPESSAKKALEDGVGIRITVEKKNALKLLPILCKWVLENIDGQSLNIGNEKFFSEAEMRKAQELIEEEISPNDFYFYTKDANIASGGKFQSIKIKGNWTPKQTSEGDVALGARQFEIQLVLPNNKNESGLMQHDVYEASKLIAARTRLDRQCPKEVFDQFVKTASQRSGKSIATVRSDLLQGRDSIPKIRSRDKGGKTYYISYPVYERWRRLNWVSDEYFKYITKAKDHQLSKSKKNGI